MNSCLLRIRCTHTAHIRRSGKESGALKLIEGEVHARCDTGFEACINGVEGCPLASSRVTVAEDGLLQECTEYMCW